MKLHELLSVELLDAEIAAGNVRRQQHPTEPLVIYNYTAQAAWDNHWNDVTEQCRGLIVNSINGEIVARPFRKFFNLGQLDPDIIGAAVEADADTCIVTEKMDGSLGILYSCPSDGHYAVATRGSFTSDQALHATEVFQRRYASSFRAIPGITYLCEILYPANRIVVDYGDVDDLVLLAQIEIATGYTVGWPGAVVEHHRFDNFTDLLDAERPNREGFVVHFPGADLRVKIKHDEYARLHRVITNTSSKTIWECLATGTPFEALLENVPDEFFAYVQRTRDELCQAHEDVMTEAYAVFYDFAAAVTGISDLRTALLDLPTRRKEFALAVGNHRLRKYLFLLFDGKRIADLAWRDVKPTYTRAFFSQVEDVA